MKLNNKKENQVEKLEGIYTADGKIFIMTIDEDANRNLQSFNSLAELQETFEDYEGPKEYWYIDCYGMILRSLYNGNEWNERRKLIGNYFKTEEEAELAIEKLQALKRLKDKGFKFTGWEEMRYDEERNISGMNIYGDMPIGEFTSELDILFGGEE